MKILHNKSRFRGEGDRQSYAFFLVGAAVVLVAVFLVGLYFGREIEKGGAPSPDNSGYRAPGDAARGEWAVPGGVTAVGASEKVRKEIGAFSEEAIRVPVVPPVKAEAVPQPADPEKTLTFQDTLAKKDAEPVPLEKAPPEASKAKPGAAPADGGILVQAGAFRDREKAESRRKKMEKAGFPVRISRGGKGAGLYLVVAGPYPDRDAARGAVARLKSEHKIDAIIQKD